MEKCIFCQIIKGKIQAKFEYKDKEVVAFWDINPRAPIHLLIVPKKHIPRLKEAKGGDKELLGGIQLLAGKLAQKLGIGEAFRVSVASGKKAGQELFHLHYHLLGGWKKAPIVDI